MIVDSHTGVTLAGAAPFSARLLARALALAPALVAADGGADRLLRHGAEPQVVIGDLDSLSATARARLAVRLHAIPEQETTDFDKALRSVRAPFVLGIGFSGARIDHTLAVLNALARHPDRRCLILSADEVCFLVPRSLTLHLRPGTRVSLFPLGPVRGTSEGLRWPIGGIDFAPGGAIGTSNEATAPLVRLAFDAPRMLAMLPLRSLEEVLRGFGLQSAAPAR